MDRKSDSDDQGRAEGAWPPERLLDDLEHLALRAPTRAEFFDEAAARLKRAVPFDGACWHTLDPGSDLITQHRLQDLPDRFPILAHNEYAVEDVNKFAQLARSERKAATMSETTAGHPERSARFRELLTPAGLGPQLRSAFVADGAHLGGADPCPPGRPARVRGSRRRAAVKASDVVRAGRPPRAVAEACESARPCPTLPGLSSSTPPASLIRASSRPSRYLPSFRETPSTPACAASIHAVASATRAAIATTAQQAHRRLPSSAVKTPAGTWLVLHGGLLGALRSGSLPSSSSAHTPPSSPRSCSKAYGLTPREQEIAQLMLKGATTMQAAQRLAISRHTVGDHIKAIFEKTGARTRGELSATLFFGEHLPRIQDHVAVGDDASFIDAPRPRERSGVASRASPTQL